VLFKVSLRDIMTADISDLTPTMSASDHTIAGAANSLLRRTEIMNGTTEN
jgi:hypothetical protein